MTVLTLWMTSLSDTPAASDSHPHTPCTGGRHVIREKRVLCVRGYRCRHGLRVAGGREVGREEGRVSAGEYIPSRAGRYTSLPSLCPYPHAYTTSTSSRSRPDMCVVSAACTSFVQGFNSTPPAPPKPSPPPATSKPHDCSASFTVTAACSIDAGSAGSAGSTVESGSRHTIGSTSRRRDERELAATCGTW